MNAKKIITKDDVKEVVRLAEQINKNEHDKFLVLKGIMIGSLNKKRCL